VNGSSAVALRVVGGDRKGAQCLGLQVGHPVPGVYKYSDLALQVGGVSDETVIYGYGSSLILIAVQITDPSSRQRELAD
jgi:hypothetical protein